MVDSPKEIQEYCTLGVQSTLRVTRLTGFPLSLSAAPLRCRYRLCVVCSSSCERSIRSIDSLSPLEQSSSLLVISTTDTYRMKCSGAEGDSDFRFTTLPFRPFTWLPWPVPADRGARSPSRHITGTSPFQQGSASEGSQLGQAPELQPGHPLAEIWTYPLRLKPAASGPGRHERPLFSSWAGWLTDHRAPRSTALCCRGRLLLRGCQLGLPEHWAGPLPLRRSALRHAPSLSSTPPLPPATPAQLVSGREWVGVGKGGVRSGVRT